LPAELAEAEEVWLRPGSVLFLPRGYWHQTRARAGSLSLNFTFDQPCWADVVLPEIRRALLREERWRELAQGAGTPGRAAAAAAERRLGELLRGLARDLDAIDAAAAIGRLLPAASENPTEAETATGAKPGPA
jgi:50S ribosomal protein L16 3-hydroxylase